MINYTIASHTIHYTFKILNCLQLKLKNNISKVQVQDQKLGLLEVLLSLKTQSTINLLSEFMLCLTQHMVKTVVALLFLQIM
jgi:hypothetical protein